MFYSREVYIIWRRTSDTPTRVIPARLNIHALDVTCTTTFGPPAKVRDSPYRTSLLRCYYYYNKNTEKNFGFTKNYFLKNSYLFINKKLT